MARWVAPVEQSGLWLVDTSQEDHSELHALTERYLAGWLTHKALQVTWGDCHHQLKK